ncbi:MAG: IS4 family transposase [Acidithiobacillus sp.]
MARTKAQLSAGARLADYLTVGYLAMRCPVGKVRDALALHDAQSQRQRGLPHEVLVYFVLAMVLYASVAYEEVLQLVVEGLRPLLGDDRLARTVVSKGAISQARAKVGAAPLKTLYQNQVQPHGPLGMAGVGYKGLRLMAIDGSTLDMPDEAANAERFGYPASSRGSAAFPQLRFVAMAECGTHTLCYAEMGSYEQSERTLAGPVMAHADATMLITADRNFYSYAFWQQSLATGARLLFRLSSVLKLPREKILADGSYLSTIYSSTQDRKKGRGGIRVRIIEYTLDGIPDAEPRYRLITNWMDPTEAPALELAALYHRRWTIESSLDELKTHLADRQVVLRSKRPELVEQEFYALLLAHAAVRHLMTEAAAQTGQAAEDLSFTHAIRVLHRRLPAAGSIPPSG